VATSVASPPSGTVLRGAEHPRIDVCPPHTRSRGQDACDLIELAGQPLDYWQQQSLARMCAVREDGKWACFEFLELVARQNGKGGILEARALAGLLLFDERLILWSAHEYKTAMEGFLRVGVLLRKLGRSVGKSLILIDDGDGHTITIKVNNTNGEEAYERLDTGQRLKFIARSKGSGRGFSPDLMIVDEAMFYTPLQHEALLPALSARPNPQIIYTSSPPIDGDSGEILFGLRDRAEAMVKAARVGALSGAVKGGDGADLEALGARIWGGCAGLEHGGDLDHLEKINLDDPALLAGANPALGIRITLETAARERRSMTAKGYARERLCIWPLPRLVAGGRIDPEKWKALQDAAAELDRDAGLSLGVELSPDLDYAAIAVYGSLVQLGDQADDDEAPAEPEPQELDPITAAWAMSLGQPAADLALAALQAPARQRVRLGYAALLDRRAGIAWVVPRLVELKRLLDPVAIGMTATTFGVLRADLKTAGMVRPEDRAQDEDDSDTAPRRGDLLVTNGPESAAACGQLIVAVDEKTLKVKPHPVAPEILDEAVFNAKTRRTGDALTWSRSDPRVEIEISPVGALTSARYAHLVRVDGLAEEKPPPPPPLVARASGMSETAGLSDAGF
jgi:hypothetical protein